LVDGELARVRQGGEAGEALVDLGHRLQAERQVGQGVVDAGEVAAGGVELAGEVVGFLLGGAKLGLLGGLLGVPRGGGADADGVRARPLASRTKGEDSGALAGPFAAPPAAPAVATPCGRRASPRWPALPPAEWTWQLLSTTSCLISRASIASRMLQSGWLE